MYHMSSQSWLNNALVAAFFFAASLVVSQTARASELLMFERDGCVWCARWDREIAPIYGKTDEAKVLPLRRINIDHDKPTDITLNAPVRYTPTFVIVDDGREIGRITGYLNDESFWGLLGKYAAQLVKPTAAPNPT